MIHQNLKNGQFRVLACFHGAPDRAPNCAARWHIADPREFIVLEESLRDDWSYTTRVGDDPRVQRLSVVKRDLCNRGRDWTRHTSFSANGTLTSFSVSPSIVIEK